ILPHLPFKAAKVFPLSEKKSVLVTSSNDGLEDKSDDLEIIDLTDTAKMEVHNESEG
ncbi:15127_t:CDS:2, partial [Gigaspora margarita]